MNYQYQKLPKIVREPSNKAIKYNPKDAIKLIREKSLKAAISQAIEIGYLKYPSKESILEAYCEQQDEFDEPIDRKKAIKTGKIFDQIRYLNLHNVPIIEIGDISLCRNLRIVNLSNNFLTRIDGLAACKRLFRLDLQNNQLEELPKSEFWDEFNELKVLYLHNNQIAKLDSIKYLTDCPCLEILTLFDTPFSLTTHYRHHVVNSIFTLKVSKSFKYHQ